MKNMPVTFMAELISKIKFVKEFKMVILFNEVQDYEN